MEKKLITIYGNSNYTVDIAAAFAIECARAGVKTLLVELGEGTNPKLSYNLGIEDQRIKTTDYYLQNISKDMHVDSCILKKQDICEMLTDKEKALSALIKKLPDELSMMLRKAPSESYELTKDEYKKAIEDIRKEGFENNDMIVMALSGNGYSEPVFFANLYADTPILITEDTPNDIRGLNRFAVDMKEIMNKMSGFNEISVYLDYGSEISIDNFEKTAMNVKFSIPLKSILRLHMLSGKAYSGDMIPEITDMVKKIALEISDEKKKGFWGFFSRKPKAVKEGKKTEDE